jgi:hypothetical protein
VSVRAIGSTAWRAGRRRLPFLLQVATPLLSLPLPNRASAVSGDGAWRPGSAAPHIA